MWKISYDIHPSSAIGNSPCKFEEVSDLESLEACRAKLKALKQEASQNNKTIVSALAYGPNGEKKELF